MINKSKSLICGLAVLTAFGLVGCGTTKSSSQASASASNTASASASASNSTSGDVVPLKDGFFTFYFHFKASEKVAKLNTWTSPYIDGVFNGWNAHPGVEMKPVEGTDMYYAQISKDDVKWADNANDLGYQLCLGYNESSGVGASSQGIAGYTYKCAFAAEFSGVAHPVWATKGAALPEKDAIELVTYSYGDDNHVWTAVKDHFMTFASQPIEPIQLKNYTLRFEVDPALVADMPKETGATETYIKGLSIKGSFNDWKAEALTKSDTDGSYSIKIDSLIANSPLSFCVAPTTLAIRTVEDKYCLTGDYTPTDTNGYVGNKDKDTTDDAGKITKVGNLTLTPLKLDGDNHTATWGMLKTYDGYTWPTAPVAMTNDVVITLTNSGTGALKAGAVPAVAGNFNGWSYDGNLMTVSTDGKSYTYTITKDKLYVDCNYQFGIITNSAWTGKLVMTDPDDATKLANFGFDAKAHFDQCDIAGDWSKLGVEDSAGTINYHGNFLPEGAVITINFVNSGTGTLGAGVSPCIPGAFDGWDNKTAITLSGDKWVYTITCKKNEYLLNLGYEFKITPTGSWDGALAATGGANLSFMITDATKTTVTVSGDYTLLGAAGGVATVAVA